MTINVELRDEQAARLDRFAVALRKTRDEATAQLIEEGLRHAEFPAIEFRDSDAGRQAYIVGSRLAVWQVQMVAEGYSLNVAETARHLRLDRDLVSQALRYATVFEAEIQTALSENRAMTAEKLRAALPASAWVDIRWSRPEPVRRVAAAGGQRSAPGGGADSWRLLDALCRGQGDGSDGGGA